MTKPNTTTLRARMHQNAARSYAALVQAGCASEAAENLYNTTAADLIKDNAWMHVVQDDAGNVLSGCTTMQHEGISAVELCGMVTDHDHRHQGLAKLAIGEAIRSVQARGAEWVFLVVRVWQGVVSPGPDQLYRSLGWHPTGHFVFNTITDDFKCRHLTADYKGGYISLEYVRELPSVRQAA